MPVDPKEVLKWSPERWGLMVKHIRPSEGGAVGVLFVFTRQLTGWPIPQADFVVKPISGTVAGPKFAERTLGKIAGARGLHSQGVARSSRVGDAIVQMIDHFIKWHDQGISVAHPQINRLRAVRNQYDLAESFLFQSLAQGMQELDSAYKNDGGLSAMLTNKVLMKNLGRLFVADALLGNGDRLDSLNAGNIAFGADGKLFAIDSDTILTSYDKILKDSTQMSWTSGMVQAVPQGSAVTPPWSWANSVLGHGGEGGTAVPSKEQQKTILAERANPQGKNSVTLAPSARMKMLFSPNTIWDYFWSELKWKFDQQNSRRAQNNEPQMTMASSIERGKAKEWFTEGVIDGLHRADSMLSGLAWLRTRYAFRELRKQHGGGANYSWTNFKLRRLMIRAAKEGMSYDDAQVLAHNYVERKYGDFEF
jgi:hypothetical protein